MYPTTQPILQQDDNEVIDSLDPAYRELPSTHFSYVSSFNGSITIDTSCCGNNQTTVLPNSTKDSIHQQTDSLSSEILNTQGASRTSSRNITNLNSINSGMLMDISGVDATLSQQNPSPSDPDLINDSSLSIHIVAAPQGSQRCQTSSTSGVILKEDHANTRQVIEPSINNGQLNDPTMNVRQSDEPAIRGEETSNIHAMNRGKLDEHERNDRRSHSKIYEPIPPNSTSSNTTKNSEIIYDSSRGASSFGGVELSPKTRAFSPDYYALTFRREGSELSDVSCNLLRGASAFSESSLETKSTITMTPSHERGASVLGGISEKWKLNSKGSSFNMNETKVQLNRSEHLNITQGTPLNCTILQRGNEKSFTVNETRQEKRVHESPRNDSSVKITSCCSPSHPTGNSIKNMEVNSFEAQHEDDNLEGTTLTAYKNVIEEQGSSKRKNANTSKTSSYNASMVKGLRIKEDRSSLRKDINRNRSSQESHMVNVTPQIHDNSDIKKPEILNNSRVTSNSRQQQTLDSQSSPPENTEPITILQSTSHHDCSKPIKILDTQSNSKTANLSRTYQFLRGASHLGYLRDDNDDVCSDSDALWDSVSLSFAYESASDEDVISHLEED